MLDRATIAARVNAPLDAGTISVLLDAVNDRAAHLVAVSRGDVTIARNDSVIDLYSKLRQVMPDWKFGNFVDVRQLHNARNQAQHEGLEPAREHIPGWASVTRAFSSSVVEAHFGVHLDRVHLSYALDEDEAATLLAQSEDALDNDDPHRAVRLASEAFSEAVRAWRSASQRSPAPNFGLRELMSDAAAKSIQSADTAVVHGAFATDPAELVWFTKVRAEAALCDAEDARRAVAFVFWWLVGWQRFKAANVDRHARAMQLRRQRRSCRDDRARVAEVLDFSRGYAADEWKVTVQIADVPADDSHFDLWAHHVTELMAASACPSLRIEQDGTALFRTRSDTFGAVVASLGEALVEADQLAERTAQRLTEERADRAESVATFRAAYEARRDEFPSWVHEVTTTSSLRAREVDAPALVLAPMPQAVRTTVHEAFGDAHVWGAIDGNWGMSLPLDIDLVLDACRDADAVIGPALQNETAERIRDQQEVDDAWRALSESLRRHGVMPPSAPPKQPPTFW